MDELRFDVTTCAWVAGAILAFTFFRYVVVSGLHYLVTYHWLRHVFAPHKLDARYPGLETILAELKLGTLNLVNFVLFGLLILYLYVEGHTWIYHDVERFGWAYLVLSVPLVFVIQDTYFYWTHRLLHTKPLMRWAHGAHHRFRNPTPFAAFAVHPLEGALEVGFRPLIVCLLPLHPYAIGALVTVSFLANALGHGGIEIYRSGWSRHPLLGLLGSATHHYVHHKYVNANYALYFSWWDKLMGTEHPKFHEEFEAAAVRPSKPERRPAPRPVVALGSCSARLAPLG